MKKIPLTKDRFALVDDSDYKYLVAWKWCIDSKGYAVRHEKRSETGKQKRYMIYMHRCLLGPKKNVLVDHINGNSLDNRRDNLRFATHQENMRNRKLQKNNTTGYKGVWFNRVRDRYVANLKVNGRNVYIKSASTALEAARAYDERALEVYGEYARLNNA